MNRESERKRLVGLIRCGVNKHESTIENYVFPIWEFLADHLLDNGVVVPPCKVGDKVYEIDLPEYGVIVCKVTKVLCDSKVVVVNVIDGHGKGSEYYFDFDDFGKTVFTSREEAEARLKGGEDK